MKAVVKAINSTFLIFLNVFCTSHIDMKSIISLLVYN